MTREEIVKSVLLIIIYGMAWALFYSIGGWKLVGAMLLFGIGLNMENSVRRKMS